MSKDSRHSGDERGDRGGRHSKSKRIVEYMCPRCKIELDPDDTECVACGYAGRPAKMEADD